MIHGRARFQAILVSKEIIKGYIHRGKDACTGGYWGGSFLWRVVDRGYVARKWGLIFSVSQKGGSRVGGPSISVVLESFCSGVAACLRKSSRRQLIPPRRVVP